MNLARLSVPLFAALAALAPAAAAQNTTAVLKGKTLVITGSGSADDLTIVNQVSLAPPGDGGGSSSGDDVAVAPGLGGTVNNSANPASFSGVTKLKIQLGDGSDTLVFDGFSFGGSMTLRAGDGDDAIQFEGGNLSFSGTTKLFGDGGDDTFSFNGGDVGGPLKISGSTGALTVLADVADFDSVNIVGGPGPDVLDWSNASIDENLKVNLSSGDDDITFDGVSIGEDSSFKMSVGTNSLTCLGGTQFGALATYLGGSGDDTLSFIDTQVGETLNIKLGPGTNSVTLSSVASNMQVGEQLLIKGGPQNDTVTFNDANGVAFPAFGVGSGVKLVLATGNNVFSASGFTQLAGLSIATGALDDTIALDGGQVQSDLRMTLANGTNGVTINDTAITGDLQITAGAGNDTVALTGTTAVGGSQKINLGGGNNTGP